MRHRLIEVVKNALAKDPKIADTQTELEHAIGYSEEYMQSIGLSKRDLKLLERQGFARRGYTKNVWLAGEKLPDGKEVPKGYRSTGRGHQVMWVLVGKE